MEKTIVMSLGGSVIVPDIIDTKFLKSFKKIIEKFINKSYRFIIYCGGGNISRNYQFAVSKIIKLKNEDLDWLGIHVTRLNAHLIKTMFGNNAEDVVVNDPTENVKFNKKILVAAGWKPGWSTDYDAVLLAKNLKINTIVNMSNIDSVYDKDPNMFLGARKIHKISWVDYRKISGNKWRAGLNRPFDPIAAKEAEKLKMEVFIIGKNIRNFGKLLENKKFSGTIIK